MQGQKCHSCELWWKDQKKKKNRNENPLTRQKTFCWKVFKMFTTRNHQVGLIAAPHGIAWVLKNFWQLAYLFFFISSVSLLLYKKLYTWFVLRSFLVDVLLRYTEPTKICINTWDSVSSYIMITWSLPSSFCQQSICSLPA